MKTLFKTILIYNLTFIIYNCQAQNIGINQTGANAHPSALLDLDANPTNNTGLLIPRLTTAERNAIASPALSLLIFNTTTNCFEAWMGSAWYTISCPLTCNPPSNPSPITGISCVVSGQTGINYSISSVVGATSYSWAVPAGYSITAGMGSNAITVTSGSVSGNVSVFASNGCGNSAITTISVQTSFLSCNAIKIANSSAPDGVYSIDPDGGGPLPCMPCQCDMTTDGGGWTLIANYSVPNFTTAADNVMNTFPLINNPTAPLGTDERGLGTPFYGRINGTNLTSYPFTEIRVDGERGLSTTATTRAHFKFGGAPAINIIKTNGIFSNHAATSTALVGNTVNYSVLNHNCCSVWGMRDYFVSYVSVGQHAYMFWGGYLCVDTYTDSNNPGGTAGNDGNKRLRYWVR